MMSGQAGGCVGEQHKSKVGEWVSESVSGLWVS